MVADTMTYCPHSVLRTWLKSNCIKSGVKKQAKPEKQKHYEEKPPRFKIDQILWYYDRGYQIKQICEIIGWSYAATRNTLGRMHKRRQEKRDAEKKSDLGVQ
jgi:hypothetical protein